MLNKKDSARSKPLVSQFSSSLDTLSWNNSFFLQRFWFATRFLTSQRNLATLVKANRLWAPNKKCSADLVPSKSQFLSSLDYYLWNYSFFLQRLTCKYQELTKNLKKNIPVIFNKVQVVRELRNLKREWN